MSLDDNAVLGIAMGSSEAAGYVNPEGAINRWLNEWRLHRWTTTPGGRDEWSGDAGVGALYFSQQCVFRHAPAAGITLPAGATNAEKLKHVQAALEADMRRGEDLGEHRRLPGLRRRPLRRLLRPQARPDPRRVTSGRGGQIILDGAKAVLESEFPEVAARANIQLPDEKSRRVGQSIAAASLRLSRSRSARGGTTHAAHHQTPRFTLPTA